MRPVFGEYYNSLILSAFGVVNLGNIYLSNLFNLGNLWLKIDQSKITNYAKRTQFSKKSNVYNPNFNNELQRKMDNGHLVKTNPNKANLTEVNPMRLLTFCRRGRCRLWTSCYKTAGRWSVRRRLNKFGGG
jgi:hypothetical protein